MCHTPHSTHLEATSYLSRIVLPHDSSLYNRNVHSVGSVMSVLQRPIHKRNQTTARLVCIDHSMK